MKNTLIETRLDRIERNLEAFSNGMLELKESQKRTDERLNPTDEQLCRTDKQLQKTIKKLDDIGDQLGDLGLVQGEVAEELFYRNVKGLFRPMDMRRRRMQNKGRVAKKKLPAEFYKPIAVKAYLAVTRED